MTYTREELAIINGAAHDVEALEALETELASALARVSMLLDDIEEAERGCG